MSEAECYTDYVDKKFIENNRKLYLFYAALQNSLNGIEHNQDKSLPTLERVGRYLSIYKRSIGDRSPMLSNDEMLECAFILAGQEIPFIHIVRELHDTDGKFSFETTFVAPSEFRLDGVTYNYDIIVKQANIILYKIMNSSAPVTFLSELAHDIEVNGDINIRKGRVSDELNRMYFTKNNVGSIFENNISYIKKINQKLSSYIYKPIINEGVRFKRLISFDCSGLHKENVDYLKKYNDIVHFSSNKYLIERYNILCGVLRDSFFKEWWQQSRMLNLKEDLNSNNITKSHYSLELSRFLFKGLVSQSNSAPNKLFDITIELMHLSKWVEASEKEKTQGEIKNKLNTLIETLNRIKNVYQIKDKKWLIDNMELLLLILNGKVPGLLSCTNPHITTDFINNNLDFTKNNIHLFLILKNKKATANAIETAEKLYREHKDIVFVHILERLFDFDMTKKENLKEYIAPLYIFRFESLVKRSYLKNLSWLSQAYHVIFNKEISEKKVKELKLIVEARHKQKFKKIIAQASTSNVNPRSHQKSVFPRSKNNVSLNQQKDTAVSNEEKALLEKICDYLDTNWMNKAFPMRDDLLEMVKGDSSSINKILSMIDVGAFSTRSILLIPIHGLGNIYVSRRYLKQNSQSLIKYFKELERGEEMYKIQEKSYLKIDSKNKHLYGGIVDFIVKNSNNL